MESPELAVIGLTCNVVGVFFLANSIRFREPRKAVEDALGVGVRSLMKVRDTALNNMQVIIGFLFLTTGFLLQVVAKSNMDLSTLAFCAAIIAFAGAHTPITMPNGTATSAASANPANTRCEDIHTSIANCPLAITVTASFHTAAGEGKNTGAIQPRPVATLHNANTLATDARLISNNQGERGDKLRS